MTKTFMKAVKAVITFLVIPTMALAQNMSILGTRGGAEFWLGKEVGKPLITVNVISGVNFPGTYHVPIDTNLSVLISYAGGAANNSKLDEIEIRRVRGKDQTEFTVVDLLKASRNNSPLPGLNDGDIIRIPISLTLEKTAQYIGIIGGTAAIILSIISIHNANW